ncbi:HlyD family secretion protein [Rugamonas rivuli]|uniref:HlyD family efflux transporter periplasmic adaptor subunit n=1 Tax=Rugamonas rivuli TaxID=2743358 RepID=A0A843SHV7_9BURK|nr:HlyD family efflux transporter periplasmic adaptor subunit [Rugamonas rivuli]MQA21690.1 HlyD family efflux transporter periplasmic adaptor subunit [Rugamonas rivuli]
MSIKQLYRSEALDARQVRWLGEIVLVRPMTFSFLCTFAVALAAVILIFLFFCSYTKRVTVTGLLLPDLGLVKIYTPQFGIVERKNVVEGQAVKRGDVLYVLSSERQSSTQGGIQASISRQVNVRQESLLDELDKTRRLQQDESAALVKKIDALESELAKINSQIEGQSSRIKLAEDAVVRMRDLSAQNFISKEQLQQKQADLLDQRARLQALERDHINTRRDLTSQRDELTSLPLRHQNQLAQLKRGITSLSQELTESEAKRRLELTAPEAGIATAVVAEIGQMIDGSKPLVSIVPAGARLQAQLYAPSKAIGFVKPGDKVLLRYQAYPYQKFGQAQGSVAFVSKIALSGNELASMTNAVGNGTLGSEPLYRITVNLVTQTVNAYGQPQKLQAGMSLDADILQERRRLYEWVLEPLYSLTGKL